MLCEALYIVEQEIATTQDVDPVVKTGVGRRLPLAGLFEMVEIRNFFHFYLWLR
jgi:3-hydroxyacyl-CoA dehydrogenase